MRQVFYGIFLLAVASLASCSGGIDPAASTVSPAEEISEISSSQVDMQAPLTMSLGFASTLSADQGYGYSASFAYGALPAAFPASASVIDL